MDKKVKTFFVEGGLAISGEVTKDCGDCYEIKIAHVDKVQSGNMPVGPFHILLFKKYIIAEEV